MAYPEITLGFQANCIYKGLNEVIVTQT
jgi:hypothetical protein